MARTYAEVDTRRANAGRNTKKQRPPLQKIFGLNLTLQARGAAQIQWASLCEAHQNFSKKGLIPCLVPGTGLEPARPFGLIHLKDKCLPISTPGHFFVKRHTITTQDARPLYPTFSLSSNACATGRPLLENNTSCAKP